MSGSSDCNILLQKLLTKWGAPPNTTPTWRDFSNRLSPANETAEQMLARLNAEFGVGNLSQYEQDVLVALKLRAYRTEFDHVMIDCGKLENIMQLPLPGDASEGEGEDDSDDDDVNSDSGDEEEEVQAVPVATVAPPSTGPFGMPSVPIFGVPSAAPSVGFPIGGSSMPPVTTNSPFGQPVAPVAQPSVPTAFPIGVGGPTAPVPIANQAGEDLPYAMIWVAGLVPSTDAKYYMLDIPEYSEEPDPSTPTGKKLVNSIRLGLFITGGEVPKAFTKTVFNNEEFDAGNKPQMAAIHAQNGARFKKWINGELPAGGRTMATLSDGVTPDAISATKGVRIEGKIAQEANFDMTGKTSKPRSNRSTASAAFPIGGASAANPFLTGPGPSAPGLIPGASTAAGPASGPVSNSRALPADPNTGQPLPLPPGAQVVKIVQMRTAKGGSVDKNFANALDAYWLPGGPRPIGIEVDGASKYTWYVLPSREIVKSGKRMLAAGEVHEGKARGSKSGLSPQEARAQEAFQTVAMWNQNNPNWYQPFGVAGSVPVGGASMRPNWPTQPAVGTIAPQPFVTAQPSAPTTMANPFATGGFGLANPVVGTVPVATVAPSVPTGAFPFFPSAQPSAPAAVPSAQPAVGGAFASFLNPTAPTITATIPSATQPVVATGPGNFFASMMAGQIAPTAPVATATVPATQPSPFPFG